MKELMYLLIFHPFLKTNFVAIILDQTVIYYVLYRTGHVQIFQVVVRSKNWSICSLTVFTVFLKLQFYFDNPFWQIWINIQYLYPIEIPLRGIARNCSRIAQHCAEKHGISWNCANCVEQLKSTWIGTLTRTLWFIQKVSITCKVMRNWHFVFKKCCSMNVCLL